MAWLAGISETCVLVSCLKGIADLVWVIGPELELVAALKSVVIMYAGFWLQPFN